MHKNLRINGQRLWDSLMEMATIGALPNGGCGRLALTDDDRRGRDLFAQWCREAGCEVSWDELGNMFATRAGSNPQSLPIATGSHLDTQPHGGKFDGVFGVLAGLEVIRSLNDANIATEAPIEVINWTNEEGSRFAPAMVASGVYAGLFEREFALALEDADGLSFGAELERIGYRGDTPCGEHRLGALFEAHIEQGPILEKESVPIGVVTGAQGQRWYDAIVRGQDSHAGSTPMPGRRDAFVGAARMAVALQALAHNHAPNAVATVGEVFVSPNSRNTIAGEVRFSIDIRHPETATLNIMDTQLQETLHAIAADEGVDLEIEAIWDKPPIVFDSACVTAVRDATDGLGYARRDIVSGAGHDACQVCTIVPAGMIFVPCEGGISHAEIESAEPENLEKGCNVLLHAMLGLAHSPA